MDELNTNHKLHKCMKYQLCSDSINKIIDSWGFAVCILYFFCKFFVQSNFGVHIVSKHSRRYPNV